MTWFEAVSPVTISVYMFLAILLVVNLPRIMVWLANQQDAMERYGQAVRRFKYKRLVPWVDRLPVSADALTLSRLGFIGVSLLLFHLQAFIGWIIPLYTIGWITDYLDGLKAQAETLRRGRETLHGKYLDPMVDMACFCLMVVTLHRHFPTSVILWFIAAMGMRLGLFTVLLYRRRAYPSWRARLSSSILPKSITGEVKAAIIGVSFGLILAGSLAPSTLTWASRLLVLAIIFEGVTLIHLVRTAIRQSRIKIVEPPRKTGSD